MTTPADQNAHVIARQAIDAMRRERDAARALEDHVARCAPLIQALSAALDELTHDYVDNIGDGTGQCVDCGQDRGWLTHWTPDYVRSLHGLTQINDAVTGRTTAGPEACVTLHVEIPVALAALELQGTPRDALADQLAGDAEWKVRELITGWQPAEGEA